MELFLVMNIILAFIFFDKYNFGIYKFWHL
jgi:hypothetical protein